MIRTRLNTFNRDVGTAYAVDLDELFAGAERPEELFRYLPLYTSVAGGIGFAIGWIIGRNV